MSLTLATLAAWLAAIGGGSAALGSLGSWITSGINSLDKGQDGTYNTWQTWAGDTSNSDGSQAFRDYASQNGYSGELLANLKANQIGELLKQEYANGWNFLGFGNNTIDFENALKQLQEMEKLRAPQLPDFDQIYQDAQDTIEAENAEVNALYDQLLGQQTANLNQQMADLNSSYKDNTNQILSSDYIKNRQLMDTATSELSRSRRNALEAGASAGLRLANNVNTMLSVQNKQAQQSLETSNNLAQMMLNQRQAAAGIRGEYNNALANNTAQRAALKKGNAERISNYTNQQVNTAQAKYNANMTNWTAATASNPWAGNLQSHQYQENQKNKYYGG